MALPPLSSGGVNCTLMVVLPGEATTAVGAFGTVTGVTLLDAAVGALLPKALVAITVQVTAVPLANPVTTIGEPLPDCDCALCVESRSHRGLHPDTCGCIFCEFARSNRNKDAKP